MSNPAIPQPLLGLAPNSVGDHADGVATDDQDLSTLAPGQETLIKSVDSASPVGRRLLDLGFVPGTVIRVVRRAPLGDPVEYEVRGTRICLRRSESQLVQVQQVTTS
jgi:ferrous iron transport protein A